MKNTIVKISLTIFYSILVLYSVINFFSDAFFVWYMKSTQDFTKIIDLSIFFISLFFTILSIIYIVKNKNMKKETKVLWIIISVLFPIALIFFVWKVVPPSYAKSPDLGE